MGVHKRKDRGTWQVRLAGPDGKVISRTFQRRSEAVAWNSERLAERNRGVLFDPRAGRVTFSAYYAEWSERQVWEATTRKTTDSLMTHVTFGDLPMGRIRRSHIEQYVKSMSKTLAASTIKTRMRCVRGVFRAAVRDQIIASDPTEGVVLPRQRRKDAAMVIYTTDELQRLLNAAEGHERVFLSVLAFAGTRISECLGLQVGDVDFLRKELHVRRQVQRMGGTVDVRPPKYGSERSVPIPEGLVFLLAQHCETRDSWLFPNEVGEPVHQNTARRWFAKAAKKAGVENLGPHALRHGVASMLIHANVDIVNVQQVMGHSSPSMTLTTYSHWIRRTEDRARDALAGVFAEVSGTRSGPRSGRKGLTS